MLLSLTLVRMRTREVRQDPGEARSRLESRSPPLCPTYSIATHPPFVFWRHPQGITIHARFSFCARGPVGTSLAARSGSTRRTSDLCNSKHTFCQRRLSRRGRLVNRQLRGTPSGGSATTRIIPRFHRKLALYNKWTDVRAGGQHSNNSVRNDFLRRH